MDSFSFQRRPLGRAKGQSSVEFVFLIGGALLFLMLVFNITRTNVIGSATNRVDLTSDKINKSLINIPPAPVGNTVPIPLNSCGTITRPGKYQLGSDIVLSGQTECISIQASNVEFNCNGHAIIGSGGYSQYGIFVAGSSVTLKSCVLRGGLKAGVWVEAGSGSVSISSSTVKDNQNGVYCNSCDALTISKSTVTQQSGAGVYCQSCTHLRVTESEVSHNAAGILFDGGSDAAVTGITFVDNNPYSIQLIDSTAPPHDNLFTDNEFQNANPAACEVFYCRDQNAPSCGVCPNSFDTCVNNEMDQARNLGITCD